MPFKGDMRLGGRHSNVATLNGTVSDFSVPAYGTVISGPTDTSRNELDYAGAPFFMPYSTTVYANGVGGTYSVETWGLQYLPAGWRTGTGTGSLEVQVSELGGSYYNAGSYTFYYQEDGTGINYIGETYSTSYYPNGQWFASSNNYGYYWNGTGGYYSNYEAPSYPSYGTYLDGGSVDINFTTPYGPSPCTYAVGTYSYSNYADGNGGSYTESSESYLPYGTVLGTCGDYTYYSNNSTEPKAYWHYYNGYVLGYGTQSTHTDWWTNGGSTGQYLSYELRNNNVADGYGNSYAVGPYTWYPPYGTQLGSGSYEYWYTDDDGNYVSNIQTFNVFADGNGSYYVENT